MTLKGTPAVAAGRNPLIGMQVPGWHGTCFLWGMSRSNDPRDSRDPAEVIAVLVSGYDETGAQRATVILRDADGHVRMEQMDAQDEFVVQAARTSCFRRGEPVRDPATGKILRYELEKVKLSH